MSFNAASYINRLWLASQWVAYRRFKNNIPQLGQVQDHLLRQYLTTNALTQYGQQHRFLEITDYCSFCAHVPIIQDWERQLQPYIARIADGSKQVLTRHPVTAFEETSGTTGFSKLIPYNEPLKKEFQLGVAVWMHTLRKQAPMAFDGCSYWSLSPALKPTYLTSGGIRVGFEDDTAYFNPVTAWALGKLMAVPSVVKKEVDANAFYFQSLLHLLRAENLTFLSVWSPSFFLQIDAFLETHFLALLNDAQGLIPAGRWAMLARLSRQSWTWKAVWPRLAAISCWTDAQSAMWIPALKQRIGDVVISRKGLLSTECVVSVPFGGAADPVLSYQSHFYEFRDIAQNEVIRATEVEPGKCYEVIVTTGGGLYRYATTDVVEVTSWAGGLPQLRFLGRSNRQSDLVGEKLTEFQVQRAISQLQPDVVSQCRLLIVYPVRYSSSQAGYQLYFCPTECVQQGELAGKLAQLDEFLGQNPYYRQALRSGQLAPLVVKPLPAEFPEKLVTFFKIKKGIRDGNVKLPLLLEMGFLDELVGN